MKITVNIDTSGALAKLDGAKKQIIYATAVALTRTAQDVKAAMPDEFEKAFDRPTAFTKNSIFIKPARKNNLVAVVQIMDRQRRYLLPEIEGGERNAKGFENLLIRNGILQNGWFAIPASGAPLDSNGNVQRGLITKILSQLQASRDYYQNESGANKLRRDRLARKKGIAGRYFAVMVGDTSHLRPGIYERLGITAHSKVRPIFVFTPKRPKYNKRFNFYGIATSIAQARFPQRFRDELAKALATAR